MKSIEESVVTAMDGSESELFPFLPYILQDLWEIGATPEVIIQLVREHSKNYSKLSILDLGCGKGAVSIKLSKEFNCKCLGIDAIKDFIKEADMKAKQYGIDHLCQFEVGDIREKVKDLDDYIFKNLKKRCNELIEKHPDKRNLFLNYIKKQEEENDVLETKVICSTMVIRRKW